MPLTGGAFLEEAGLGFRGPGGLFRGILDLPPVLLAPAPTANTNTNTSGYGKGNDDNSTGNGSRKDKGVVITKRGLKKGPAAPQPPWRRTALGELQGGRYRRRFSRYWRERGSRNDWQERGWIRGTMWIVMGGIERAKGGTGSWFLEDETLGGGWTGGVVGCERAYGPDDPPSPISLIYIPNPDA